MIKYSAITTQPSNVGFTLFEIVISLAIIISLFFSGTFLWPVYTKYRLQSAVDKVYSMALIAQQNSIAANQGKTFGLVFNTQTKQISQLDSNQKYQISNALEFEINPQIEEIIFAKRSGVPVNLSQKLEIIISSSKLTSGVSIDQQGFITKLPLNSI